MLGIYETLPEELLDIIWKNTHKANMKTLSKEINKQNLLCQLRDKCLSSTQIFIDNYENRFTVWDNTNKNFKHILILEWVKHFKLYKLIFGKEKMIKIFRYVNLSNYIVKLFSNRKITYNTKYSVPSDKKPLPYFCDKYIKKNGYKGKPIRSWERAFYVLWNEL